MNNQNDFFRLVDSEDDHPFYEKYEIDNEDIENSVVDEYGVRYSIDGIKSSLKNYQQSDC